MNERGKRLAADPRTRRGGWLAAIAVVLLAWPAGLAAARHGATLRLKLLDGRQLDGELLAARGEALLLLGRSGGVRADLRDVAELLIVRENNVGKGLGRGLAAGFLIGGLIGVPLGLAEGHSEFGPLFPILILGGLGGGCGAIVGGGVGIITSGDEKVRCRGRDDAWRAALLKRLRRLARFRDDDGLLAAAGVPVGAEIAAAPQGARAREFRRWRLDAAIVQSPPVYARAARAFVDALRYGEPLPAGGQASAQTSHDDGQRSWLGVRELCLAYAIDRRWALGIRVSPLPWRGYLYGRKDLAVAGQGLQQNWNMYVRNHVYFLTASCSVISADGFLRDKALRLTAGLGWNRARFGYGEIGSGGDMGDGSDHGEINYYSVSLDTPARSSFSALAAVEAAHCFNSRWSLALDAGFRYAPLRIRGQETSGFIDRQAPSPDRSFALTVPGTAMNLGGFYLGIKLGFDL